MKLNILLFVIIPIITLNIYSQEDNKKNPLENQKIHQFGITIKRTNYSYIPSEYNESKNSSYYLWQKSEELKNDKLITYPVSFLYYNKNWNLFSEFSYYKVSYAHLYNERISVYIPNFNAGSISPSFQTSLYNTITRRELKNNFYTKTEFNSSNQIFYGLGIRNLFKESYGYKSGLIGESSMDSTNSYGLQIYFKYQMQIVSFLKLSISAEPFYTVGNRIRSRNLAVSNPYLDSYSFFLNDKNAKNYFYGVDADFNLSFALNENLNLLVGYNYIYTKIRREKNRSYFVSVYEGQISISSLIFQSLFSQQSHESKDHINGYYIGLNASF